MKLKEDMNEYTQIGYSDRFLASGGAHPLSYVKTYKLKF